LRAGLGFGKAGCRQQRQAPSWLWITDRAVNNAAYLSITGHAGERLSGRIVGGMQPEVLGNIERRFAQINHGGGDIGPERGMCHRLQSLEIDSCQRKPSDETAGGVQVLNDTN